MWWRLRGPGIFARLQAMQPGDPDLSPPRPARRWRRRAIRALLILIVLLAVLVLLGPVVAAPYVRARVVEALDGTLRAHSSLRELSFDLGGSLHAGGFGLDDLDGRALASVEALDCEIAVLAALRGRYQVEVELVGFELHVWRAADGALNLAELLPPPREPAAPRAEQQPRLLLPDVRARVRVRDGKVFLHAAEDVTELDDVRLSLDLAGLSAPFELAFDVRGAGAPGGELTLAGRLELPADGSAAPRDLRAAAQATLERVSLAALGPALRLAIGAGGLPGLQGELSGEARLDLAPGMELSATVELATPELGKLTLVSQMSGLAARHGTLEGELACNARVPSLARIAGALVPLEPGLTFEGTLAARANWSGELAQGSLRGGSLDASLSLADFVARDAAGRPLALDDLRDLELELGAAADLEAGSFTLSRLELARGPVTLRARAQVTGLSREPGTLDPSALAVADSSLELSADLDRLARCAAALCDLGGLSFGGQLGCTAGARQVEGRIEANGKLDLRDLALRGLTFGSDALGRPRPAELGPLSLSLEQAVAFDPRPGGRSELSRLALRSDLLDLDATGALTDATDPQLVAGSFSAALRLHTARASATLGDLLGDLLGGLTFDGGDVVQSLALEVAGPRLALRGELAAPELRVAAPGLAPGGLSLDGLAARYEGSASSATRELELGALTLDLRRLAAELAGAAGVDADTGVGPAAPPLRLELDRLSAHAAGRLAAGGASLSGGLDAGRIAARGGGLGAEGMVLSDLAARLAAIEYDAAAGELRADGLELACNLLRAEGSARVAGLAPAGGPPQIREIQAKLSASGEAEALRRLAGALAPELATARAQGTWELALESAGAGAAHTVTPRLALRGVSLQGHALGAQPLELAPLDLDLSGVAELELAGAGVARLKALRAKAPGLDLSGNGECAGFLAPSAATAGEGTAPAAGATTLGLTLDARLAPGPLGEALRPFLGGVELGGRGLDGALELRLDGAGLRASGSLSGERLALVLPRAAAEPDALPPAEGAPPPLPRGRRRLVQEDLALSLDLSAGPPGGLERVELRALEFRSRTAEMALKGVLTGLDDPRRTAADLELTLSAELARVLADLGGLAGLEDYAGKGRLAARYELRGSQGRLGLAGLATIKDFQLEVAPPARAGASPPPGMLRVADPQVKLDLGLALDTAAAELSIERCALASRIVHGTLTGKVRAAGARRAGAGPGLPTGAEPEGRGEREQLVLEGLKGDFRYVPERLAVVLAPWLPGTLSGSEEEALVFELSGRPSEVASFDLLRALRGKATLGTGHFATLGLATAGGMELDARGDELLMKGDFSANQGRLTLDGKLDLRRARERNPSSSLRLALDGVHMNPELGALLGFVHPVFAAIDKAKTGSVSGLVACELELTYDAPLPPKALAGGWLALPKKPINGRGRLEITGASVAGSPLFTQLLEFLGRSAGDELVIAPLDLRIDAGRVAYGKPWTWKLAGERTTFAGSIGLDRTLALRWSVPVSAALVERYGFLKSFAGETIEIPIGGTLERPELSVAATLKELGRKALERELKGKLGGGVDSKESPADLLRRADDLYEQGHKGQAAALYQRLRSQHGGSPVYLLNRVRIDARAELIDTVVDTESHTLPPCSGRVRPHDVRSALSAGRRPQPNEEAAPR